jgi:anti-sigma-K factor RskA
VTIQFSTIAGRLDGAVELLVSGHPAHAASAAARVPVGERELVDLGARLRDALVLPPVGTRFEARLGARLAEAAHATHAMAWARRHPRRLIVTGAVGSAVGVGVTAYAVWRSTRRSAVTHRLLHR